MRAVNLLTPDLRSAPKGKGASGPSALETPGGIGAFVVLGALALVVAAVAGYVLSSNVIKDRKAELAQVSAQSDATVAKANKLKPYADFETIAKDRAGTVQALAGARFDWEQALRDLSRAMPDDVFLSSLDGNVGGGATGAGSSLRGAIQSPAIELKGCTKSQPAVATLMSRMRNVQGVTRVTLAKSDKDGTAAGASGSTVNPCGKGSPPSFEMIIFFERSAVAEALAGATGAAEESGSAGASGSTGSGAKDGSASGQQSGASGKSGSSPSTSQPSNGATPPAATTTGGTQ
jgi:Tfp pilus assembly protein PilN